MSKSIHFRCPDDLYECFELYMKMNNMGVTEAAIQLFDDGMRQEYWENQSLQEMDRKIDTILTSVMRNMTHTTELTQRVGGDRSVFESAEKKWDDIKYEKGYQCYEDS